MRFALALAVASAYAALPVAARAGGGVDWQRKVVTCTGSGAANLRDAGGNPAVARIGAEKAAKLDALRNCLEAVKGVRIDSGQTAGNVMASDQAVSGKVQGLVKGFKVVGAPRYFSDGGVELDVEVPLDGAMSDALLPRPEKKDEAKPEPKAEPKPAKSEGGAPLGTSLVVDARGQKVIPALSPRILDEGGKEIYGPSALSEAGRKAGGTAAYANDLVGAKAPLKDRLGDKPFVLKAVRTEGSDVVISSADAAGLAGKDLGFLADAKVVILAD
jgi:hypothetical protein